MSALISLITNEYSTLRLFKIIMGVKKSWFSVKLLKKEKKEN